MEIKEVINNYDKESLFDIYHKIVNNFKEYNKITKEKIKEAILKEYNDYNNIIDICTTKELEYLKQILENNAPLKYDNKYKWEIFTLENKLLVIHNDDELMIPDDLHQSISLAIKNINWKEKYQQDKLNEVMIGICKVHGEIPTNTLINITSKLLNINEEILLKHIENDKVFNYYISLNKKKIESNKEILVFIYSNYLHWIDKLNSIKKENKISKINILSIEDYKSIFYNGFNLNNKVINKFYKELIKLKNYEFIKDMIISSILLNSNKEELSILVKAMYSKELEDIEEFINLLNNAIDEMPSAALNGLNLNQLKNNT